MENSWEKGLAVLHDTDRDRFFDLLGKGEINVSTGEPVSATLYDEIIKLGEKNNKRRKNHETAQRMRDKA